MDHVQPTGPRLNGTTVAAFDITTLLGDVTSPDRRSYVVVEAAQTVDGRIATANGDSQWLTGPEERRVTHAIRAACEAAMVGIGAVLEGPPC